MKRVDVCNGCEKKLRSLLQTPSLHTRSLAGGSPAASYFSCFAKKSNQKKATPLRRPSASRSQQSQVGQCGNSLRLYFEGSEAQTSALLLTGLSPSSAAASEGEVQRQSQNPNPGFPRACGPRNDESRSFAMPSLRGGEADEAIQSRKWIFTSRAFSPLCRRGRRAELGDVEASVFEHVAAKQIVRVCEPPNSGLRPRLAPKGRHSGVAFSLVTFSWPNKRKSLAAGQPPAKQPLICGNA